MTPRLSSLIRSVAWLSVGTLLIGILLPASATPQRTGAAPPTRQRPAAAVTSASYVIGPVAAPDARTERLNSLVWRRGKRPDHQAVATPQLVTPLGGNAVESAPLSPVPVPVGSETPPSSLTAPPHMIATTAVNVHSLPGSAVKLFALKQGDRVEVISTQGLWTQIQGPSGPSGWVYSSFLKPDPA